MTLVSRTSGPLELLVDLDRAAPEPLRDQLASRLRDAIRLGSLRAGVRLPASRVLAAELRVSRGVVVEAYDELHAQGFLRVTPRSAPVVVALPGAARQTAPVPPPRAPLVDFSIETVDTALFDRRGWLRAYGAALDAAPGAALSYGDPRGQPELRGALADYLGRARAVAADPRDIVICQGSIQGVQLAARLLVRAGVQRVALEDPCGAELRAAVTGAGLSAVALPTDASGLVVEALAGADVGAAFLTPAHQYPGGGTLSPERRQALLAWARASDALLVEDDYDGELRYGRRPVGALQGLARERVIYVGTASRTLVPALRLGWIVVPPQLADEAGALRWQLGGASPSLDQLAFARLLTSAAFERGVRRLRVEYARRRTALLAALERALPGATPGGSAAGLHLTLALPRPVGVAELAAAADAQRVRLRTVEHFRASPAAATSTLLLGFGRVPGAAAPLAAALLEAAIEMAGHAVDRSRW
jgi:GntR family transcriptional regulator / MocR family aminotransferase